MFIFSLGELKIFEPRNLMSFYAEQKMFFEPDFSYISSKFYFKKLHNFQIDAALSMFKKKGYFNKNATINLVFKTFFHYKI